MIIFKQIIILFVKIVTFAGENEEKNNHIHPPSPGIRSLR